MLHCFKMSFEGLQIKVTLIVFIYKNEINTCKCTDISLKRVLDMVTIPLRSPEAHEG